jgi:CheY-like chemotaxis protein
LGERPGRVELRLRMHQPSVAASELRPMPQLPAGKYVELVVKDNGCGMSEETLQHVFEPFFSTKKPGEGTGLGLSVVHGIVKDHDGIIHVDSTPNQGSTFYVLLPLFTDSAPAEEVRVELPLQLGNGERILFIDDEPTLCSAAQKLLGKLNYSVTTSTKPNEAVQLFRADPTAFDLVLTDLTMPGMTGVDVAVQVLLARPNMPLILATGFNASWTLEAVRAMGIRDLVMKPLSTAVLSEKIHAALRAP